MIEIYSSRNESRSPVREDSITKGCWIRLIRPTDEELSYVCEALSLDKDELMILLDEEERPRVEYDDDISIILIDTPYVDTGEDIESYTTIPAGFVLLPEYILTVSLRKNPILDQFASGKIKNFSTEDRVRFILLFLYKNADMFVQNLRQIDRRTSEIEKTLKQSTKNEQLFHMLTLSKSLVYITNSLKGNEAVLKKLSRSSVGARMLTEDDRDLLDDAIIENRQALEMAQTFSETIASTMGAFASIINNNANWIMKLFTCFAAVLTVPMLVAGYFGMNVDIPLTEHPQAFFLVVLGSLGVSALLLVIMFRKKII
ncbi:hypothetical protein SDC9_34989 [bioreactor metagenome]|uniref:Cobalt/magnesium transport protein CorA n=1 Tax=bioreactor metagenome TaxID=1076179 RepID=A0A644VC82_9ZZZZ|nr:magnesium transporter CorA family protein [Methanocorpusculum sp.]